MRRFLRRLPDGGGQVVKLSPGSAQFDGNSSLQLAGGVPVPAGQGLTIALWIKNLSAANAPNVITQTTNPSVSSTNMWWYGFFAQVSVFRFVAYANDTTNASAGNTGFPANGSWAHFLFRYDDTTLNAPSVDQFVNNIHGGPAGGMDKPMTNNGDTMVVGNGFGDGFGNPAGGLVGAIDSLFIWQRVLTTTEAGQVWNNGAGLDFKDLSGSLLTNLFAAYNLDGPIGNHWPDSSGNGRHLIPSGTVIVGPERNT